MNGSLAMRSTRLRTLLLVLVGGGMVLSLYLLTSSQYHLKDARRLLDACQQQKDSLLAQLQVVYEQKNRVEKSLQQEKLDHRKTLDDSQKNNALRIQVQKAKTEVETKLSALQKDQLTLQERYRELESQTKDLKDHQIQNEEKHFKLQSDYEQTMKIKEEELKLLRGNMTLVLQERDTLENQVVKLNNNYQQMKNDFHQYKRMYEDINQRLKKLSQEKRQQELQAAAKMDIKVPQPGAKVEEAVTAKSRADFPLGSFGIQAHAADIQEHGAGESMQHGINQRHPLPAPNLVASRTATEENKAAFQPPTSEAPSSHREVAPQPQPDQLRQQLQPPDFDKDHAHHQVEPVSTGVSSPGQAGAGNQPLLPPPPPLPQDSKVADAGQVDNSAHHQGELHQNLGLQSQEQKDQDTLARKPIPEPHLPGLAGQDLRAPETMFMGGLPSWHHLGVDLPVPQQQQQQIKAPDSKARASNNNNNNRHQEEEENYPEDGDDDNAEEQDDTLREKNMKPFQDHDFEDNDGNDHNHAREEGIMVEPK